MEEPKTLSIPELEACINIPVKLVHSTMKGEESIDVRISKMIIPWHIIVPREGGGSLYGFAAAIEGIIRIEKEGKIVYENKKIPVPYPFFDLSQPEKLKELNDFRRECFGEGFDYVMSQPEDS